MGFLPRLVGLVQLVLYAVLAALVGRLLNHIFNGASGYTNIVTLPLMLLCTTAIICNGAWALALLTHGHRNWKLGAALSATSGLLMLCMAAKHIQIGGGYDRLTTATVSLAIISGGISILTGLALLMTRDHVLPAADYATGTKRSSQSV